MKRYLRISWLASFLDARASPSHRHSQCDPQSCQNQFPNQSRFQKPKGTKTNTKQTSASLSCRFSSCRFPLSQAQKSSSHPSPSRSWARAGETAMDTTIRTERARSMTLRINYLLCSHVLSASYIKYKEAERRIVQKDDRLRPIV